jgi:archaellum biogenesis protein FlaJ (TadC family)
MRGFAEIARRFAKVHAYTFYVLRSTFKAILNDGWEDWKALLFISGAMVFPAIIVMNFASIALQHRIAHHYDRLIKSLLFGAAFGILFLNYYALMADRKWARFEHEFKRHSKSRRVFGHIAVWVGLIVIVAGTFLTRSIATKLPQEKTSTAASHSMRSG